MSGRATVPDRRFPVWRNPAPAVRGLFAGEGMPDMACMAFAGSAARSGSDELGRRESRWTPGSSMLKRRDIAGLVQ